MPQSCTQFIRVHRSRSHTVDLRTNRSACARLPTLKIVGTGGKPATIPLPRAVAGILADASGDRTHGPILVRPPSSRSPEQTWTRRAAALALERLCRAAGIDKPISPHSLRHTFVTLGLDAGVPLRDMQVAARHSDPRITARHDRGRHDFHTHANNRLAEVLFDR